MNLFESIGGLGINAVSWIVPFLFVLTIVVFFHELGHFLVARWCGVTVKTFSLGFGPELAGFFDRHGTRWRISAIPLGGYVKFLGDENESGGVDQAELEKLTPEERKGAFAEKGVAARAAIVAAGPIANFILAIVIFTGIFTIYGREEMSARVDSVVAGSVAEKAGFQPGDLIVSIDGKPVATFTDLQRIVSEAADVERHFIVKRGDAEIALNATPAYKEITDRFGNKQRVPVLGIARTAQPSEIVTQHFTLPQAAVAAVQETWFVVDRTVSYLVGVVVGRESADQLGGPIRVAEVSAQVATLGIGALINLAAILSISIGLINLLPVPILDGGHLLFFAVEAVRGRPLSERAQDIGFRIGFVAVVMLMLFTTWQDIIHLNWL